MSELCRICDKDWSHARSAFVSRTVSGESRNLRPCSVPGREAIALGHMEISFGVCPSPRDAGVDTQDWRVAVQLEITFNLKRTRGKIPIDIESLAFRPREEQGD